MTAVADAVLAVALTALYALFLYVAVTADDTCIRIARACLEADEEPSWLWLLLGLGGLGVLLYGLYAKWKCGSVRKKAGKHERGDGS